MTILPLQMLVPATLGFAATYDNPAGFTNALGSAQVTILNFDAGNVAGQTITTGTAVHGVTFTYSIGNLRLMISDTYDTVSGLNSLGLDDPGNFNQFVAGDRFALSFPDPVFAVGLYYITADPLQPGDIELVTSQGGATNSALSLRTLPDGGLVYFVGFVAPAPFQSVELGAASAAAGAFLFKVDDVTYAAATTMPEPAALGLVGGAVLIMAMAARRRRQGA